MHAIEFQSQADPGGRGLADTPGGLIEISQVVGVKNSAKGRLDEVSKLRDEP